MRRQATGEPGDQTQGRDDGEGHLVLARDPFHTHLPAGMEEELRADIDRLRLPELEPAKGWRRRARRRAKH